MFGSIGKWINEEIFLRDSTQKVQVPVERKGNGNYPEPRPVNCAEYVTVERERKADEVDFAVGLGATALGVGMLLGAGDGE